MPHSIPKPLPGRIYKHYKGDLYLVRGFARHSETGEELVIYQALYGSGEIWARPLAMFLEPLPPDLAASSGQSHRFALQDIPSRRQSHKP